MGKVIRLTENDLNRIVKKALYEEEIVRDAKNFLKNLDKLNEDMKLDFDSVGETFSNAFSNIGSGLATTFKEMLAGIMVRVLGLDPNTGIGFAVVTTLGQVTMEEFQALVHGEKKCENITHIALKAITSWLMKSGMEAITSSAGIESGFILDSFRNTLVAMLDQKAGGPIAKKIADYVCPRVSLDFFANKAKEISSDSESDAKFIPHST